MRRRLGLLLCVAVLALPQAARAEGFTGAGSTLAFPVLSAWGKVYATLDGEGGQFVSPDSGMDYEPVGSLGGVIRVIQRAVDFGATDVPLPPAELDRHGLAQFPFVTGGVAVVANLRGIADAGLRLDGDTLARIYLGEITRWSDPAIAALNPGVALTEAPIAVVRRRDGSGTTWHFANYLAGANAAWRDRVGVNTELNWPVGVGAKGNQEVAETVRATANSIGYVEASLATRLGLPVVLIRNAAGSFVRPTPAALAAAAAGATWDPAQHFFAPAAAATAADAYPIVATVYALMQRRPASTARTRRALEFFRLALFERAADATALGFVPLPLPVASQVAQYWRANIRGAR